MCYKIIIEQTELNGLSGLLPDTLYCELNSLVMLSKVLLTDIFTNGIQTKVHFISVAVVKRSLAEIETRLLRIRSSSTGKSEF